MSDFPYRFNYGEPALVVEIYAPSIYEPELRVALDRGMDLIEVKKYMNANLPEIQKLLENASSIRVDPNAIETGISGYSIYRGNGAFWMVHGDRSGHVCHDDISFVRLCFLPPFKTWFPKMGAEDQEKARFSARRFLRFWTHDQEVYEEAAHPGKKELFGSQRTELIERLTGWLNDIGQLVNGFLMHRLCKDALKKETAWQVPSKEVEFWIGSFRCVSVNKITTAESECAD